MNTLAAPLANDQGAIANLRENFSPDDLLTQLQEQAAALTRAFITFCQTMHVAKLTSNRPEWRQTKESLGWASSTATPYARVGEWLGEIDPSNLELLDINAIKALCNDKYLPIIARLKRERLTVAEVREEMKAINKEAKKPKEPPKVFEWKQTKGGNSAAGQNARRFCVIRLEDPDAGAEFEQKYKASGAPLPLFIRGLLRADPQMISMANSVGSKVPSVPAVWVEAQEEVAAYIERQSAEIDEIQELEEEIQRCDHAIAQYTGSTNPSECMVRRVAMEEKTKYQQRMKQLEALQLVA